MNVNIYGVGRSGTKIIQLYTCLAAVETRGSCVVSYEPFLWRSRRCLQSYAPGVRAHRALPMLVEAREDSTAENPGNEFLAGLHGLGQDKPVIAKYIRANGRIPLIQGLGTINKTIFVLRELAEVLRSIHSRAWDLLGAGPGLSTLGLEDDWERLTQEIRLLSTAYPYRDWLEWIDPADRLDRNAFYWAVMNHFALTQLRTVPDKLLVNFDDLKADANATLYTISDFLGWNVVDEDFRSISGARIHDESKITSCRWKHVSWVLDLIQGQSRTRRYFKGTCRKMSSLRGWQSRVSGLPIEIVCRSPRSSGLWKPNTSKFGQMGGLDKPIYQEFNRQVFELFHKVRTE